MSRPAGDGRESRAASACHAAIEDGPGHALGMAMSPSSRLRCVAVLALLAAPLAAGCEDVCSLEGRYGLAVAVLDPTQVPLADATVTLRDGDYVETLGADDYFDGQYKGAIERAGIYVIEAKAPGFQAGRIEGIRVRVGDCHVDTREVELVLARQ
jgi:hypothetical protein